MTSCAGVRTCRRTCYYGTTVPGGAKDKRPRTVRRAGRIVSVYVHGDKPFKRTCSYKRAQSRARQAVRRLWGGC